MTNFTLEDYQEQLADVDLQLDEVNVAIAPLLARRRELNDGRKTIMNRIYELRGDDFEFLLNEPDAFRQMESYLVRFFGNKLPIYRTGMYDVTTGQQTFKFNLDDFNRKNISRVHDFITKLASVSNVNSLGQVAPIQIFNELVLAYVDGRWVITRGSSRRRETLEKFSSLDDALMYVLDQVDYELEQAFEESYEVRYED